MILLCILDGFGLRPEPNDNAVVAARKPNIIKLFQSWPNRTIEASALAVGLPEGQMGNSEVGHLNLGAGRVVYQDITAGDFNAGLRVSSPWSSRWHFEHLLVGRNATRN